MKKIKVAVLAGGSSTEREISLRSGQNLFNALNMAQFYVDLLDPNDINFSFPSLKKYDIIYPILHGTKGEDGCIQGILEYYDIPYIGCDILASALTMNKYITKKKFQSIGIPCARGFVMSHDIETNIQNIESLGYPVFIKPIAEGSSIGALILHNQDEVRQKLPSYIKQFPHSLIEEFIYGREMTVGVIEQDGEMVILPILELKPKAEFYDFDTKYTEGLTEFILPAPLTDDMRHLIHEQIKKIFIHFNLKDCIRVDLILTKTGPLYLEINTAPGMTETSDIPAMLHTANIKITDFVSKIIQNNLEKTP